MKNCCSNCFADQYLQKQIEKLSNKVGDCDFCCSQKVFVIDPVQLSGSFETLCSIYEESTGGASIIKLLNHDWHLFNVSEEIAEKLLQKIFDDSNRYLGKFKLEENRNPEGVIKWRQLKNELLTRNRYFLETEFQNYLSRLKSWLTPLCINIEKLPSHWYRARIEDERKYCEAEMRAPPAKIASGGRANPIGIPYLYLGSEEKVVINEVRPHINDGVSIAMFQISNLLRLIDLRETRSVLFPFLVSLPQEIVDLREDITLFEEINNELSRPVSKNVSMTEYIPSQYFCEFIKYNGFDGIAYESSFGNGYNVALFSDDDKNVVLNNITSVIVSEVNIEVEDSFA